MFCFKSDTIYSTLLLVLCILRYLEKVAAETEVNDLAMAEAAIRGTFNNLFITFQIRDVAHNSKLKQFSIIHNVFVSITINDGENLKQIIEISRVYNITNNTQNFMMQINDIFNEGDKSYEVTDDKYVDSHIVKCIKRLANLQKTYTLNRNFANYSITANILKYLDDSELTNVTNNYNDVIWKPTDRSGRRIYQGHRTRISHYPFVVSIQFFERFQCAGSIIDNDLVITAASCLQLAWNNRFFRENPAFLSVQVGSNFYEVSGENIPVYEIYFHPKYTPKTLRNNLAILRLNKYLEFTKRQKKIRKIEFDRNPSALSINTDGIIIIGWGAKDRSNIVYDPWINKLSFAELDYYLLKECQEVYSKEYVTYKNFCAGFISKASGACQNDIGGPGIVSGILVGVVSFGPPMCGTPDAPTVFTKIGYYAEWIDEIINLPAPIIIRKTTLKPPETTRWPYYTDMTTTHSRHLIPIDKGDPALLHDYKDYMEMSVARMPRKKDLRILGDDELFQEFLSTMFVKNDEDYSGASDDETTERETSKNPKRKDTSKTTSTPPLLEDSYTNEEIAQDETNTKIGSESIKPYTGAHEMNTYFFRPVTKLRTDEFYEEHVSKIKSAKKIKKSIKIEASVDQSIDDKDSIMEKDIVELLNDIDIRNILASEENSSDDAEENIAQRAVEENVSNEIDVGEDPEEYLELVSYSSEESISKEDDKLGLIFDNVRKKS